MKKLATFASAAALMAAAGQASAAVYDITGDFNVDVLQWSIPFIVESGSYDTEGGSDGMGGGNWNVTAELEAGGVTGGGTINFDQEFDMNATDGSGYFYQPTNCTGNQGSCDGLGGNFFGDINSAGPLPIGPGVQAWDVQTQFAAVDFTPTLVPVPAAAWLFGSALVGLAGVARRRAA